SGGGPAAPCRSKRRIVVHPRIPRARGAKAKRARIVIRARTRGIRPRAIRIRGRRVVVDLRGSRAGRIVVTISVRRGHRTTTDRRVYLTCTPSSRRPSARAATR
ncbi:MAG: hypothetical protein M3389_15790, partial [Actinomycetota bacterium]|nr:hypothetical protein [Actinomycetota bacterium]